MLEKNKDESILSNFEYEFQNIKNECLKKFITHIPDKKDSYKNCSINFLEDEIINYAIKFLKHKDKKQIPDLINLLVMLYGRI
jgi:hypothetical protein